ncbi:MAG TPA: hypothetical protein EYP69_01675 [Bacteroidales bacterium]|nr:hypothetical protein [Bacteroidales bacterium]
MLKKRNTIIHIGYPKTASSWLQNQLFIRISNYRINSSSQIKEDFILQNSLTINYKTLKDKYTAFEKPFLISHELLVGGMIHMGGINGILTREFANRLYTVFPDAQIILFVRNQPDMIASAYNQYLRGGGNYSINKYLYQNNFKAFNKYFFFSFDYLKFDITIDFYKKLFGKDKVFVFLYEEFKENPKIFIENLIKTFNLDVDLSAIDFTPQNTSFRRGLIPIIKFSNILFRRAVVYKFNLFNFNRLHKKVKSVSDKLNKFPIFGSIKTSKELLGKKNYEFIWDYYKKSNSELIKKHNLHKIEKYNYPL